MADMIAAPGEDPPLGETERERLNRNFNELLQELRVLQTGVQILFAFMLTLPFAAGFDRLSDVQRDVYGLSLLLVAAATACLLGPVACHRMTFRRSMKPRVVIIAHHMMVVGLLLLLLSVVCAVEVAAASVFGTGATALITAVVAGVMIVCCVVIPIMVRVDSTRERRRDPFDA